MKSYILYKKRRSPDPSTPNKTLDKNSIKEIAQSLMNAPSHCKKIWEAIKSADYKKAGKLRSEELSLVLEQVGSNLKDCLGVTSSEEMLALFDEDEDGALREDEQISIFLAVKERMFSILQGLYDFKEYHLYKSVLDASRSLDLQILLYQQEFRRKINKQELEEYHTNGKRKLKNFRITRKLKFDEFSRDSEKTFREINLKHSAAMEEVRCKPYSLKDIRSVKLSPMIQSLNNQEQLLAAHERPNEAEEATKEHQSLKETEEAKREQILKTKRELEINRTIQKQLKEKNCAEIRMNSSLSTLTKRYNSEESRLSKEVKLHFNNIIKNQSIASRVAQRVGNEEARRMRLKVKQVKNCLTENRSKSVQNRHAKKIDDLKTIVKSMKRIYLHPDESQHFNLISSSSYFSNRSILDRSRTHKVQLTPLTSLYNNSLIPID